MPIMIKACKIYIITITVVAIIINIHSHKIYDEEAVK